MDKKLQEHLLNVITPEIIDSFELDRFVNRIKKGDLLRETNPISHCCAMIVVYDSINRKVFAVNHRKAGMWLFPGGHIESNELPKENVVREIKEELGLDIAIADIKGPFGLQIIDIENPRTTCKEHYDCFYVLEKPDQEMVVDERESSDSGWFTIPEVLEKIADSYYKRSVEKFVTFMGWSVTN
ncbi:MAG: NUDIX domain-containing protein [Microgenomates group bacterium]